MLSRKSYAKIELQEHQCAKKRIFEFESKDLTNLNNESLVKEVVEVFDSSIDAVYSGDGEWAWLQNNKQNNFIKALVDKDISELSRYFANMFRNEATYGYLSPSFKDVSKNKVQAASDILCNLDTCVEFTDLSKKSQLESIHGNPYGLKTKMGQILPDTPRHFYYGYNVSGILSEKIKPSILEIGGGYGGFCSEVWKRFEGKCTITNIDLVPGLTVTYYFLAKHGIPVNLLKSKEDYKNNSVNLISAGDKLLLNSIPQQFDLVFNSRSLCEMGMQSISEYFEFINCSNADYFYHENSNFLLFSNSERHIEIIADDFPIDQQKYSLKFSAISPFTGGSGRYREYVFEKKSS